MTDNGILMTCGRGDHGVQGHHDNQDCLKPKLVEDLIAHDVVQVFIYSKGHTVCLQRKCMYISFSHAIGFCFDERSAALLFSRMRSLIGPRPSDYPHALSACYYFLQAVSLLALGLWSSLPARQLSLDTSYSFLTFSVFFFFFFFF